MPGQSCYFGKYSPHLDTKNTKTVAFGLKGVHQGNQVTVAGGCSEGKEALTAEATARRALQSGCGCVSCPCPSGGGPEPYMCERYNRSDVEDAILHGGAEVVVLAVGLGANVESEGRDREARGLALPGLQNNLTRDAMAAAKVRKTPSWPRSWANFSLL